jgi:hypothetical protein
MHRSFCHFAGSRAALPYELAIKGQNGCFGLKTIIIIIIIKQQFNSLLQTQHSVGTASYIKKKHCINTKATQQ